MRPTAAPWTRIALLVCVCGTCRGGDVTSTRLGGFPIDWGMPSKWSHSLPGVSSFPDNGNEGHTYDVFVPNNQIDLDLSVTIDSLSGQYDISLQGNTFEVIGEMAASFGALDGGTLAAGTMRATSTFLLDDIMGSAGQLTLENNADLRLDGASHLSLGTLLFTGDGDVYSDLGAVPSIDMASGIISKTGGNSVSDIQARIATSDLTISNTRPGTSIRFGVIEQSWGLLDLVVDDSTIEFSENMTVSDVVITSSTGGGTPRVTWRGDVMLSGTLSHTVPSGPDQEVACITAEFGTGSLIGGTLNCTGSAYFVATGGATIGEDLLVTNMGNFTLKEGTIKDPGVLNLGSLFLDQTGPLTIDGTLCNQRLVYQTGNLILNADAKIINETGEITGPDPGWDLTGNITAVSDATAPSTMMRNEGVLNIFGSSATIGVPYDSTFISAINLTTHDLLMEGGGELRGKVRSAGGSLIIDPATWTSDAPMIVDARLNGSVLEQNALIFRDGRIDLIFVGPESIVPTPVTMRIEGTVMVEGGGFGMTGPTRVLQDGGVVGESEQTGNSGNYTMRSGELGVPGLRNSGTFTIEPSSAESAVIIGGMQNTGTVRHLVGIASLAGTDLRNEGLWVAPTQFHSGTISTPGDAGFSQFINTGTIKAESFSSLEFKAITDSTGTVIADAGTITFSGNLLQYDDINEHLTGGIWQALRDGRILIENQGTGRIRKIVAPAIVQFFESTPQPDEPWAGIESVDGTLDVSDGSSLDLTSNGSGGDFDVEFSGDVGVGELILRGDTRGLPSTLITERISNRGRLTARSNGIIRAMTQVELLDDGMLIGDGGAIETPLVLNTSGHISPGQPVPDAPQSSHARTTASVGSLAIDGSYEQGPAGVLTIDIAGESDGQFDRVSVSGVATLNGTLIVSAPRDLQPAVGTRFTVLTAAAVQGTFSKVSLPAGYRLARRSTALMVEYIGPCPADLDGNGLVDLTDLTTLLDAYPGAAADLDGDGDTDRADIAQFMQLYIGGCGMQ